MGFKIRFTGHETAARRLLLEKGFKTAKELALMSADDVEKAINAEYAAFEVWDDWMLVPQNLLPEFNDMTVFIRR